MQQGNARVQLPLNKTAQVPKIGKDCSNIWRRERVESLEVAADDGTGGSWGPVSNVLGNACGLLQKIHKEPGGPIYFTEDET